ncbi:MAG: GNAT family N-acetyltransferase [Pseudomonadota bacterium]|uniref:GNAT family N-acetyltransferase n=1 Tax=Roseovarius TaxID=74030 RepID=UPI0022A838FF|nr:GNAT family N-acetyltransferase [Roseovarius sp. EGI FJ00037]MCZ0812476.1 GNAT family N-acetyltransferase [Roseovarius sp. EGI FJ00037]
MTPAQLYAVVAATWPAAETRSCGAWTIRDGQGGGKRVSAATARADIISADDLPAAESAMRALGQTPLFMIRAGDEALDALLAGAGYSVIDPVNIHLAPVTDLNAPQPHSTSFAIWEPLAIQIDMWAQGGIGPGRLAVMRRAQCPRTSILARDGQRPAATAYVGLHDGIAMVHALEVAPHCRRRGMGRRVMLRAAAWARENGATHIAAVCTQENAAANALYASLGMALVGQYHYRIKEEAGPK